MKYDLILFIFCYMGYIWSIFSFCQEYLSISIINKIIFGILLFTTEMLFSAFNELIRMPYILNIILINTLFISLFFLFFRGDKAEKLFTTVTLITVKTLVWNFSCSFLSFVVLILLNTLTNGKTTFINTQTDNVIASLACLILIAAIIALKKKFVTVFNNKIKNWFLIMSLSMMFIVIIVEVVNWGASNGIMVVSNANGAAYWNIYYNQLFSHTAICLLTILSTFIAAGLVFGTNKIYTEQIQKEQYHSRIEFYKMLNEQYSQMERLRHDMKNHMLSLYSLCQNRELDKLENYIADMMESGNIITANDYASGNTVIDALLYNKGKLALKNEIKWECNVQIPKNCQIYEFDLCVLFGNILDNAINSCIKTQNKEQKFIHVQSMEVKNCLLLVVKNGTALSSINEVKNGIGLLNVYDTAYKYNGVINKKLENHIFEISLLLPLNNNAHDIK